MIYENPSNKEQERMNNIQYKFLNIVGIATIIFVLFLNL